MNAKSLTLKKREKRKVFFRFADLRYVNKVNKACRRQQNNDQILMLLPQEQIQNLIAKGHKVRIISKRPQRLAIKDSESLQELYWVIIDLAKRVKKKIEDERRGGGPGGGGTLFREFVDEKKLGGCFFELYDRFFGADPKVKLKGAVADWLTFAAYLFILVEFEGFGADHFGEKGKLPFFKFLCESVGKLKESQRRTFHSRLTKTLDDFRTRILKEPRNSDFRNDYWKRNVYLENFLSILEIFHEQPYYNELKPLLE